MFNKAGTKRNNYSMFVKAVLQWQIEAMITKLTANKVRNVPMQ